jgi:hypothetical protein
MRAVDTVEAEVRELVRRRGLDPIEDRAAVRRLVDEVISDYDDRVLTSSPAPLTDTQTAARTVFDAVAGFGPLQRHLDTPEIEEIWINERPTGVTGARRWSRSSPAGWPCWRSSMPLGSPRRRLASARGGSAQASGGDEGVPEPLDQRLGEAPGGRP